MKHFIRFLSTCMAVVMMCTVAVSAGHTFPEEIYPGTSIFHGTTETGIYGTEASQLPYPITSNYFNLYDLNEVVYPDVGSEPFRRYFEWYGIIKDFYGSVTSAQCEQALAYMWAETYRTDSPEIWPEEYFDIYEKDISNYTNAISPLATDENPDLSQFRVDNYSIDNGTLYVNCEADYSIEYSHEFYIDNAYNSIYEVHIYNDFEVTAYCAVTDKTTGDMVYFTPGYGTDGRAFRITPEYEYGKAREINYTYYYETGWTLEKDLGVDPNSVQGTFSGTNTGVVSFKLPDFYDSAKHDLTICFRESASDWYFQSMSWEAYDYHLKWYSSCEYYTPCNLSEVEYIPKVDPIPGDVDGDGEVTVVDAATLSRYLSGGNVEIADTSDITGDEKVVTNDLAVIRRIFSGGEL